MWFQRLPSDRALRACAQVTANDNRPFVLTHHEKNTDRIYCLNRSAEAQGLHRGMGFSDARAYCPELQSQPADTVADARFLQMLARWSKRYCPWVGLDGADGLVLNIAGSAHLFGGEAAMLDDMRHRLARAGLNARIAAANTRGAAWALTHYGRGAGDDIRTLPVTALRLDAKTDIALQRLGLRRISDLVDLPRATIARRFGPDVVLRLDQAMGAQDEVIAPLGEVPHYGVRLTFPDPIGLTEDVMMGTKRLLARLCEKLKEQDMGARKLQLTLRRVDQSAQQVELRLAAPMRDAARVLPLFERGVNAVDAGFGIDQLRLEATQVEPLLPAQITTTTAARPDGLDDLVTRLGNRIGLENIQRFLPADSHIPERSFQIAPAAYSEAQGTWARHRPRPLKLFVPEPIAGVGSQPPVRFRWRRMTLTTGRSTGPERIAPQWWLPDEAWRSGVRDYWKVDTCEGRRLWLFYTPQTPGWFVHGEFA
ncbi:MULTISPECIES: Y-family DNA polymerase [Pacificibacter]|uniref:Y-family DNA polymerase n=1 Tax=Pacificibacter TaxID=1042323 RepID=UPI001C087F73|nr:MULTISPECIES: DNA polymerase Y family protein [Pacificibacter]MBU2936555.1 DNA polymerase Y family protein [Pacificibacter marinus]MDO6614643.1 DNA polymerase Y family protein [Pacificibacter sp. 1_MG-2023]